jgi:hypothetical protein
VEREPGAYFAVAACPQQGDADQIQAPLCPAHLVARTAGGMIAVAQSHGSARRHGRSRMPCAAEARPVAATTPTSMSSMRASLRSSEESRRSDAFVGARAIPPRAHADQREGVDHH